MQWGESETDLWKWKEKMECPVNTTFWFLQDGEYEDAEQDEYVDGDEKNQMRERIAKKLKKDTSENVKRAGEGEVEKKSISRRWVKQLKYQSFCLLYLFKIKIESSIQLSKMLFS